MDRFAEIKKLHGLLNEAGIPHTFGEFPVIIAEGYQIRVYADEEMAHELDDCVCHMGSHGYSEGLLETYYLNNCDGWETAEQVFEGWQKMYNEANQPKIDICDCTIVGAGGEVWEGSAPTWD